MYQRSNSSAKEVYRGRQQKIISRQPLQSSSSSAAAAAAAVTAAGAEAAWRGLDRVRELCWQTTDRGLQRRAMMFSCMAEALEMTGWPDEHDVACHRPGKVVHRPGATRMSSASAERRSAETPDWARKTRASMGVRGWQDRDENMGGWN